MQSIDFEGKKYISSKAASLLSKYTTDYIGQLCRAGKLECTRVGRVWYVTESSLAKHQEISKAAIVTLYANNKENLTFQTSQTSQTAKTTPSPISIPSTEPVRAPIIEGAVHKVVVHKASMAPATQTAPAFFKTSPVAPSSYSFLPTLRKKNVVDLEPESAEHVSDHDIAKKNYFSSHLSAAALTVGLIASVMFAFSASGVSARAVPQNSLMASVASVWQSFWLPIEHEFSTALSSFFPPTVKDTAQGSQGSPVSDVALTQTDIQSGMVVVPSQGAAKDQQTIARIQNSFSDEVSVTPNADGTAGIITPVFKNSTGPNYLYVLVPVNPAVNASSTGPFGK